MESGLVDEIYQNALRARDVLKGLIHETPLT